MIERVHGPPTEVVASTRPPIHMPTVDELRVGVLVVHRIRTQTRAEHQVGARHQTHTRMVVARLLLGLRTLRHLTLMRMVVKLLHGMLALRLPILTQAEVQGVDGVMQHLEEAQVDGEVLLRLGLDGGVLHQLDPAGAQIMIIRNLHGTMTITPTPLRHLQQLLHPVLVVQLPRLESGMLRRLECLMPRRLDLRTMLQHLASLVLLLRLGLTIP